MLSRARKLSKVVWKILEAATKSSWSLAQRYATVWDWQLFDEYPHRQFPLVVDGRLAGIIDRNRVSDGQSADIAVDQAEAISAHSTVREAVDKMLEKSVDLLVVLSTENAPIGVVTLHDVLRAQNQLWDADSS